MKPAMKPAILLFAPLLLLAACNRGPEQPAADVQKGMDRAVSDVAAATAAASRPYDPALSAEALAANGARNAAAQQARLAGVKAETARDTAKAREKAALAPATDAREDSEPA